MNNTFHRFLDLPWELRDQIWNLAIRPSLPGVHIFRVYNLKKDGNIGKNVEVLYPHRSPYSHRLAAPRCKKSYAGMGQKLHDNNPSTCLIDGGLWNVCKESRLVMQRNFSWLKWQTLLDEDWESFMSMPLEDKLDMPATGCFAAQDGHGYIFTVFPHRDLFILRPQNLDTVDWGKLAYNFPLASVMDRFEPVQNIALEYDREWGLDMVEKVSKIVLEATLTNIWIVDHSLRRRHADDIGKLIDQHGDNAAFCLQGWLLVEVDCYGRQDEWKTIEEVSNSSGEEVAKTEMFSDSRHFIRHVQDRIIDYEEFEEFQGTFALMRIGLLGYDCL